MLIHSIPLWIAQTNAWIVADEGTRLAVIIDAPPDPEPIGRFLEARGLAATAIILTHGHIDHVGGSGSLARMTGAGAYVHADDDFLTLHPETQLKTMFGMTPPGEYGVPQRFDRLVDGETLEFGSITLEVLHTPGHTPGHCCLYSDTEGVLFSGDQLFAGSVGRADLPGGSWPELMASMREKVMALDDEVRVLPGHGSETTIGRERRTNPFRMEWAQG